MSEKLKPFEGFIGKTFKGEFSNSTPENPLFDVQYWRILKDNAIRDTINEIKLEETKIADRENAIVDAAPEVSVAT